MDKEYFDTLFNQFDIIQLRVLNDVLYEIEESREYEDEDYIALTSLKTVFSAKHINDWWKQKGKKEVVSFSQTEEDIRTRWKRMQESEDQIEKDLYTLSAIRWAAEKGIKLKLDCEDGNEVTGVFNEYALIDIELAYECELTYGKKEGDK